MLASGTSSLAAASRRAAAIATVTVGAWLLSAPIASAHVTVQPARAEQGSYTSVVFHVPSEEKNVSTTRVEVVLPTDHPIASVRTRPLPGWTAKVEKTPLKAPLATDDGKVTEAVSKVVWSGGQIGPDQFEEFELAMGPLPGDTDVLVFKTLQTYSDGRVARWISNPSADGSEPDDPAPVLHLAAPPSAHDTHTTGSPGSAASAAAATSATDILARGLSVAALVAVAAVAAVVVRRRHTR